MNIYNPPGPNKSPTTIPKGAPSASSKSNNMSDSDRAVFLIKGLEDAAFRPLFLGGLGFKSGHDMNAALSQAAHHWAPRLHQDGYRPRDVCDGSFRLLTFEKLLRDSGLLFPWAAFTVEQLRNPVGKPISAQYAGLYDSLQARQPVDRPIVMRLQASGRQFLASIGSPHVRNDAGVFRFDMPVVKATKDWDEYSTDSALPLPEGYLHRPVKLEAPVPVRPAAVFSLLKVTREWTPQPEEANESEPANESSDWAQWTSSSPRPLPGWLKAATQPVRLAPEADQTDESDQANESNSWAQWASNPPCPLLDWLKVARQPVHVAPQPDQANESNDWAEWTSSSPRPFPGWLRATTQPVRLAPEPDQTNESQINESEDCLAPEPDQANESENWAEWTTSSPRPLPDWFEVPTKTDDELDESSCPRLELRRVSVE
ncbi:hypothetical protein QBC40DRAFT_294246 [Triangularia verruculosa]|uniref:Uncharacterized protein n=1 Tax=Triangularia verruculosa TaxID=2587418 RepID=A0AAN7AY80_9PEZI|nr:hypothetical protein QBC40DRAFT_294246 [Triangularia verruculosa]